MEGCWISKQTGNLQTFNNVGKEEGTVSCYGHIVLRNPHWPGWTTIANVKPLSYLDKIFRLYLHRIWSQANPRRVLSPKPWRSWNLRSRHWWIWWAEPKRSTRWARTRLRRRKQKARWRVSISKIWIVHNSYHIRRHVIIFWSSHFE